MHIEMFRVMSKTFSDSAVPDLVLRPNQSPLSMFTVGENVYILVGNRGAGGISLFSLNMISRAWSEVALDQGRLTNFPLKEDVIVIRLPDGYLDC